MEPTFVSIFKHCIYLGLYSLLLMTINIVLQFSDFNGAGLVEFNILVPSSFFIANYVIIFFVAILGCFVMGHQNKYTLLMFGALMVGLTLLSVGAGSLCFYSNHLNDGEVMINNFNETMKKYYLNKEIQQSWDIMQHEMHCCGIESADDWLRLNETYPKSCCVDNDKVLFCQADDVYVNGCYTLLWDYLGIRNILMGCFAILIAVYQCLIVLCCFILALSIRFPYQSI